MQLQIYNIELSKPTHTYLILQGEGATAGIELSKPTHTYLILQGEGLSYITRRRSYSGTIS